MDETAAENNIGERLEENADKILWAWLHRGDSGAGLERPKDALEAAPDGPKGAI